MMPLAAGAAAVLIITCIVGLCYVARPRPLPKIAVGRGEQPDQYKPRHSGGLFPDEREVTDPYCDQFLTDLAGGEALWETRPQPHAVCMWGTTAAELADQLASAHFGGTQ